MRAALLQVLFFAYAVTRQRPAGTKRAPPSATVSTSDADRRPPARRAAVAGNSSADVGGEASYCRCRLWDGDTIVCTSARYPRKRRVVRGSMSHGLAWAARELKCSGALAGAQPSAGGAPRGFSVQATSRAHDRPETGTPGSVARFRANARWCNDDCGAWAATLRRIRRMRHDRAQLQEASARPRRQSSRTTRCASGCARLVPGDMRFRPIEAGRISVMV